MTIRGNYHILYGSQLLTGLITYPLCVKLGILGLVIGFLPFLLGMIAVMRKHQPDEREMQISYQINSYEGISAGVLAGVIYYFFPGLNWFFALIAGVSIARGIIGLIWFSVR